MTPQLAGVEYADSLPYASTPRGACYEVCPVKINVAVMFIHVQRQVVRHKQDHTGMRGLTNAESPVTRLARLFAGRSSSELAQRRGLVGQSPLARKSYVEHLPGPPGGWTAMRDLFLVALEMFRQ